MARFARSMARRRTRRNSTRSRPARAKSSFTGSGKSSMARLQTTPFPITNQHDAAITYRRKPMPRRRKRAWIKYSRKVKAVIQSSLGSNFFIILRSAVVQNNLNKQAVYNGHTVMGLNGAATDTNDVSQIFDRAIAASLLSQKDSGRLMVTGWMAETQVVNSGTAPAYLDMYYWRCTRLVPAALNKFENVWSVTAPCCFCLIQ